MAATYVTKAELRTALGIGSLYSDTVVEEVCQASENLLIDMLAFNRYNIIAQKCVSNVATIYFDKKHDFWVGSTVVVTNAGSKYNGSKTITAVDYYQLSYTVNNATDEPYHALLPFGTASGTTHVDYTTIAEVRQAALMIAVDIWQARQASNAGGVSPDFQPSPYRMGNTLLARVRGLIANWIDPNGLVG